MLEINTDKGIDLVGRLKTANVTKFPDNACCCCFSDTGIERKNSYSDSGSASFLSVLGLVSCGLLVSEVPLSNT